MAGGGGRAVRTHCLFKPCLATSRANLLNNYFIYVHYFIMKRHTLSYFRGPVFISRLHIRLHMALRDVFLEQVSPAACEPLTPGWRVEGGGRE